MRKIQLLFLIFFSFLFCDVYSQDVDVFAVEGGGISATNGTASGLSNLIDGKIDTDFTFEGIPNSIVFKAAKTYVIKEIELTSSSRSAEEDPKNIEISGSHDGLVWETIRSINNFSFAGRKETKSLAVSMIQPYLYFRLNINSVNLADSKKGALAGWRILGEQIDLPKVPTDVRANPQASNEIRISWRDRAEDEDSYVVQRTGNGSDYKVIATLPSNTTFYVDKSVDANTPYTYKVCATKDKRKTAFAVSNTVGAPKFTALTSLTEAYPYVCSDQQNSSPNGEKVECAFDNDVSTKFFAGSTMTWLRLDFEEAFKVTQYSLTSANDSPNRDPRNWKLEGSNDATKWVALDIHTDEQFDWRFQKRFFEIDNTTAYKHYRLTVGKNNGDQSTQLADWLVYADVPSVMKQPIPSTPTNFQIEVRAWHHVKLSWDDVQGETSYRIERSEDGGVTFNHVYDIPANNFETYPYSLKPEKNYVFKLYAVNGDKQSSPVTVSGVTPKREFVDKWENYKLWILDKPATFTKVKEINNTAFYIIEGYGVDNVDSRYYQHYADNWDYVFQCYGEELSDSRLHVLLIPEEGGGGLASISDYRGGGNNYTNMVYIKANKAWFKNWGESGYIYDVMAHELCHIVEGVGGGYSGSMFYPIWGDSRWAEILQYDVYSALGSPRAQSWHENMNGSSWYRDFFYPTYDLYGKTEVLKKFWKLLKDHYRMRNGDFQGSSTNPGGRGNLGELIHFWSGACGVDVKPYAVKAFGWNEQSEMWLQRARIDYPEVTYKEVDVDNSYINICQNGGELSSNINIKADAFKYFIDNNYKSFTTVKQGSNSSFELTYSSKRLAIIDKYLVAIRDKAPSSWELYASNDNENWTELDSQKAIDFQANDSKIMISFNNKTVYKYYKFVFQFEGEQSIELAEIELWGTEHSSAPFDLSVKEVSEKSTYITWSSDIEEVAQYELERAVDGVNFVKIADVSRYEISYTDNLPAVGAYYYRVATINKNAEKAKVFSNISYINLSSNGLSEQTDSRESFYYLLNNLGSYPQNKVMVYAVGGNKVFEGNYLDNNLVDNLKASLENGVYIVSIWTGNPTSEAINGKIIVH